MLQRDLNNMRALCRLRLHDGAAAAICTAATARRGLAIDGLHHRHQGQSEQNEDV